MALPADLTGASSFVNGVYWIGKDGNVWVKGNQGTNAAGRADANTDNYWQAKGYELINDPSAAASSPASASSGDGGASAKAAAAEAAKIAANTASRNAVQQGIDSLGTELNTGYGNIDNDYNSLLSKYDKETAKNQAQYDSSTVQNNENLQKGKQNALTGAAQGYRGLRSTLASLGALGGDGAKLAGRAASTAANQDIGAAADTFATNAQNLDTAWGDYQDEDADRRAEAATQRNNQRTALEGRIASKRQGYYNDMAGKWGDIGRGDDAAHWLRAAGDLNNEIASKTATAATPFSARSAAFTPGTLESYLAGAGDMTVETADGGIEGGSAPTVLAGRKRDEKKTAAATV